MAAIEWLDSEVEDMNSVTVYPIEKARKRYEVRELPMGGHLVLNPNEHWMKFAVLQFYTSESDGTNEMGSCVFHGEGPHDALRECRHTWWGEECDGYLFYPNGQLIAGAFEALSEFFDDMKTKQT